jgi:hypothetical protein
MGRAHAGPVIANHEPDVLDLLKEIDALAEGTAADDSTSRQTRGEDTIDKARGFPAAWL